MREKALILIGLKSRKWLCDEMGFNILTLHKRLKTNRWKLSEISRLNEVFEAQNINL